MKLTKATIIKIIKEELGELEFPSAEVSEEASADSDSAKLKQISQVVSGVLAKGYGPPGRAMGDALIKISEILGLAGSSARRSRPESDPTGGPLGAMDPSSPSHVGQYVTDPNTGQKMYAKSGPKRNK